LDRGRALGMSFLKKSAAVVLTVGALGFATQPFAAKGHGGEDVVTEAFAPDLSKDNGMYFFCTPQPPQEPTTVVIQDCEGKVPTPGKGCEGERREVKLQDFYKELLSQISVENIPVLKDLDSNDVGNFSKRDDSGLKDTQIYLKLSAESAKELLEFLKSKKWNPGSEISMTLKKDLKDLIQQAKAKKADLDAINMSVDKINSQIVDLVEGPRDRTGKRKGGICDPKVTINLNSADDKGTLLHTVLVQYDPKAPKKEILMNGRLEKTLVGADGSGNRFKIFDTKTKITWHDTFDYEEIKAHYEKMRPKPTVEFNGIKYPDLFLAASALCESKGLRAPTVFELEALSFDRELAKNLGMDKGFFWWSSTSASDPAGAMVIYSGDGSINRARRLSEGGSVRCVSGGA
jgi:hypothetical protein